MCCTRPLSERLTNGSWGRPPVMDSASNQELSPGFTDWAYTPSSASSGMNDCSCLLLLPLVFLSSLSFFLIFGARAYVLVFLLISKVILDDNADLRTQLFETDMFSSPLLVLSSFVSYTFAEQAVTPDLFHNVYHPQLAMNITVIFQRYQDRSSSITLSIDGLCSFFVDDISDGLADLPESDARY